MPIRYKLILRPLLISLLFAVSVFAQESPAPAIAPTVQAASRHTVTSLDRSTRLSVGTGDLWAFRSYRLNVAVSEQGRHYWGLGLSNSAPSCYIGSLNSIWRVPNNPFVTPEATIGIGLGFGSMGTGNTGLALNHNSSLCIEAGPRYLGFRLGIAYDIGCANFRGVQFSGGPMAGISVHF